jgi:hypothetical protein
MSTEDHVPGPNFKEAASSVLECQRQITTAEPHLPKRDLDEDLHAAPVRAR